MNGMAGKVLGLLVSIGLIIGGLSGTMVLRGTDSSGALVAAGFAFLAWDIFSIVRHLGKKKKEEEAAAAESVKEWNTLVESGDVQTRICPKCNEQVKSMSCPICGTRVS